MLSRAARRAGLSSLRHRALLLQPHRIPTSFTRAFASKPNDNDDDNDDLVIPRVPTSSSASEVVHSRRAIPDLDFPDVQPPPSSGAQSDELQEIVAFMQQYEKEVVPYLDANGELADYAPKEIRHLHEMAIPIIEELQKPAANEGELEDLAESDGGGGRGERRRAISYSNDDGPNAELMQEFDVRLKTLDDVQLPNGPLTFWTRDQPDGSVSYFARMGKETYQVSQEDFEALQTYQHDQTNPTPLSTADQQVTDAVSQHLHSAVEDEMEALHEHPIDFARRTEVDEAFEFGTQKSLTSGGYYDILRPDSTYDGKQRFVYSDAEAGARFREHTSEVVGYEPEYTTVGQDPHSVEWRALELYYAPQSVRERAAEAAVQLWLHEQRSKPTTDPAEEVQRLIEDREHALDDVNLKPGREQPERAVLEALDEEAARLRVQTEQVLDQIARQPQENVSSGALKMGIVQGSSVPRDASAAIAQFQHESKAADVVGVDSEQIDWINGQAMELFARAEQIVDKNLKSMMTSREEVTDTELAQLRSVALNLALNELQQAPPSSVAPAVLADLQRKYAVIHAHMSAIAVARLDAIRKRHLLPPVTLNWFDVAREVSEDAVAGEEWADGERLREQARYRQEEEAVTDAQAVQRQKILKNMESDTVTKVQALERDLHAEMERILGIQKVDPLVAARRKRQDEAKKQQQDQDEEEDPRLKQLSEDDREFYVDLRDKIADAKEKQQAGVSSEPEPGSIEELKMLQKNEDDHNTQSRGAQKKGDEHDEDYIGPFFNVWNEEKFEKRMEKEEELQGPKRTNVNPRDFIDFSRPYMRGMMIFPLLDRRTTQQTGKGKIHGFYSLMVVGNGNGLVGVGEARDMESPINARNKALVDGVKNMDWVDRFEERTIWSEVQSKMGAVKVIMRPRPVGFGLHCNPYIHQILKAAGIKDVSAKVWGSRNPLNVIKTTIRMLQSGHPPLQMGAGATIFGGARRREGGISIRGKEAIERERGRKLVAGRAW